MNFDERFWSKTDTSDPEVCWPWSAFVDRHGYGMCKHEGKMRRAHRVAYELAIGPIPEGLTIDHVKERGCVRRDCINPAHLEAVTFAENQRRRRRVNCTLGHPIIEKWGERRCWTCRADQKAKAR